MPVSMLTIVAKALFIIYFYSNEIKSSYQFEIYPSGNTYVSCMIFSAVTSWS